MKSLRQGTLHVVLAATLAAAWACSSDSSTPAGSSSGSTSGSGATSGSAASGSATSGSATSGSATSGSATSGSATSGSATSGSATSGATGDDGGGMTGDDGGGMEAATTVPETGAPAEAGAPEGGATGDGGADTFTAVYTSIIGPICSTCHAPGGTGVTTGGLDMSTQATAYTNLVGKPAGGIPACKSGGGVRVVKGNAGASLLYNKVSATTPKCGVRMPRGGMLAPADITLIQSWINAGAPNN